MALGDALGAETEFLDVPGILRRFPPTGPQEPPGNPARVTDDTQMALAVGEALVAAPRPYSPDTLKDHLQRAFIDWYNSPDNNRAPGRTCMTACEHLIDGMEWREACVISSKGCGANMRVMPVGVLNVDAPIRAKIAQFQAAFTHGHPPD
jgi:ADP-ribosylglycohydrolase